MEKNLDLSGPLTRLSGSLRQGAVLREQFSIKERQRLPDTTPFLFSLPGEAVQITLNHSDQFSREHPHLFEAQEQYRGENTSTKRNNRIEFHMPKRDWFVIGFPAR